MQKENSNVVKGSSLNQIAILRLLNMLKGKYAQFINVFACGPTLGLLSKKVWAKLYKAMVLMANKSDGI